MFHTKKYVTKFPLLSSIPVTINVKSRFLRKWDLIYEFYNPIYKDEKKIKVVYILYVTWGN